MPRAPKRCQKCNLLYPTDCRCLRGWATNRSRKLPGNWKRLCRVIQDFSKQYCMNCGKYAPKGEVDHKIPRSRGGTDDLKNLQWLCKGCHLLKTIADRNRTKI